MESEKVKEIKKALEYAIQVGLDKFSLGASFSDTLTLINELESKNERLNKSDTSKEESSIEYYTLYRDLKRENKKLSKEIDRLYEIKLDLENQLIEKGWTEYEGADEIEKRVNEAASKKIYKIIIQALEERKERVKSFYGIAESVGVDIAIRTVKELAKQPEAEIKEN